MAEAPQTAAPASDDVDPQIRRFQRSVTIAFARYPDLDARSLSEQRRIAEDVRRPWTQGGPAMHRTVELRVGELATRIRIHYPTAASPAAALVYLHGGGWTIFSLDTHDRVMRQYAARAGVAVVGIDYSLSPQAKFPRAIDETVSIIAWLRSEGAAHGIDAGRLAIGGDSAGANLSVAANLLLRAIGAPVTAAMLLNYGAFDHRHTPSYVRYDGLNYMLTAAEMDGFWRNYLRDDADRDDPLACPLRADLRGLPPAFLAIAECDVLADANRAMAEQLRAAGNPVESTVYRGATHSFLEAIPISALADQAYADASRWLRATLDMEQDDGERL